MSYRHRRYRRRSSGSFGSVVNDSAHIAAWFGPVGAMVTGIVGFALFYIVLPLLFTSWFEIHKAETINQLATALNKALDDVMLQRLIQPSEWAGISILIVCCGIALWKLLQDDELSPQEIEGSSILAKHIARFLQ